MFKHKILILFFMTFALSSCIEEESTNVSSIINGIEVPPEPDRAENNATLNGVDSNNDGVRDDVEIEIASKFGDDSNKHKDSIEIAKIEKNMLEEPSEAEVKKYIKMVRCDSLDSEDYDIIVKKMLNTVERKRAYNLALTSVVIEVGPEYECD